MTFCIGIKSKTGVIALSDTRISSGLGISTSKKVLTYQDGRNSFFVMSSGLRSIRDKVKNFFEDKLDHQYPDKLYKAADLLGETVKKVRHQDLKDLTASNFMFDAHFIVGGQCENDKKASLFLILPEGNWVEVSDESPYVIIGNTGFGKPILRRLLHEEITFDMAIKVAYLSFDATYKNASDVDFPVDFILYKNGSKELMEFRKTEQELKDTSTEWNQKLVDAANALPPFIHFED
ncbi:MULTISPECIES: peptidase [unclassified Saccharicrinis]|uniref:peptidase n=1 Tax=unclassified Saccharicrinis TaxID=2646859 RepID=UPI003D33BF5F